MRSTLVPFLAALVGGAAGAVAATRWLPATRTPSDLASPAADPEALHELRAELRSIRELVGRPKELAVPPTGVGRGAGGAGDAVGPSLGSGPLGVDGAASPALAAAIEQAVAAGIAKAKANEPANAPAATEEPKKHVTVAEAARELNLTSAQEDELREAYRHATDRLVKAFAEPEQTPDELRRELEEAKGDPGKRTALVMKFLPKMLGKLPEMISIGAERDTRIRKAVGKENVTKLKRYRIEEDDPFGFGGDDDDNPFSVGVKAGN